MERNFFDRHRIIHWLLATTFGTLFFGGICSLFAQDAGVGFAIGFAANQILFFIDSAERTILHALHDKRGAAAGGSEL